MVVTGAAAFEAIAATLPSSERHPRFHGDRGLAS